MAASFPGTLGRPMRGTVTPGVGIVQGADTHRRRYQRLVVRDKRLLAGRRFLSSGGSPPNVANGSDPPNRTLSSVGQHPYFQYHSEEHRLRSTVQATGATVGSSNATTPRSTTCDSRSFGRTSGRRIIGRDSMARVLGSFSRLLSFYINFKPSIILYDKRI
jgi:hypothetical protein